MTASIYRSGTKFLDVADETHRHYQADRENDIAPPDYSQRIPLGRDKETGEIVWYTVDYKDRLGIFGTTGSGKTQFAKALLSRLFEGGMKILHASDIKNDFHDIDNKPGISKKMMRKAGFAPGEERTPIPVQLYMPKLLANEYPNQPPYYVDPFTLGFEDVSRNDLEYLIPTNSTRQEVTLNNVLDEIGMDGLSFQRLYEVIEEQDGPNNVKLALRSSIESLEQNLLLSNRYRTDPLEQLDEQVVVLALENWDRFKRSGLEMIELYIAVTLRRLKEQLRDNEVSGPVTVFLDEAHAFCSAGDDSISKREVVDLVDLGRAYKVPMIFSTQHPAQLPNPEKSDKYDVVGSINHFFLAPNLPEPDWKQCLKASGMWRQYGNKDIWRDRMDLCDQYDFLYLNKEKREWRILEPFAPLCAHT